MGRKRFEEDEDDGEGRRSGESRNRGSGGVKGKGGRKHSGTAAAPAAAAAAATPAVKALGDGFVEIDPNDVYFTHARIRPFFTGCGHRVEDTLLDIVEGRLAVASLPTITVIANGGAYFSLNNRRLYVFKKLRERGVLTVVKARLKGALDREKERYIPSRCSMTARIMMERPNKGAGEEGGEEEVEVDDDVEGDAVDTDGGGASSRGKCVDGSKLRGTTTTTTISTSGP